MLPRASAAVIAIAGTAGLVLQYFVSLKLVGSPVPTLWLLLGYFTILTNILVVLVFVAVAIAGIERCPAYVLAGTALSILLVGVIYYWLLHVLSEVSGVSRVANVLLHLVTPVAVPLYWIAVASKGKLRWPDPLLWAVYPLAYFGYALLRGEFTGKYPYPFIDVSQIGWQRTAINACLIAVAYLGAGFLVVVVDRRLSRDYGSRLTL